MSILGVIQYQTGHSFELPLVINPVLSQWGLGEWTMDQTISEVPSHFGDSVVYSRKSHKMGRQRIDSLQASC